MEKSLLYTYILYRHRLHRDVRLVDVSWMTAIVSVLCYSQVNVDGYIHNKSK